MAAISAVSQLKQELGEIGRFMETQRGAGRSIDSTAATQSSQFEAKLARIGAMHASEANALTDLFGSLPFTEAQKDSFATRVAESLAGGRVSAVSNSTKGQQIMIEHYLPQQLWDMLDDQSIDIGVKVQQLANLFSALDVRTATEPSGHLSTSSPPPALALRSRGSAHR